MMAMMTAGTRIDELRMERLSPTPKASMLVAMARMRRLDVVQQLNSRRRVQSHVRQKLIGGLSVRQPRIL